MPATLDLDFLTAADVGYDNRKRPGSGVLAEADREVLAEVSWAEPHGRSHDAQLVHEVSDGCDLFRIGGRHREVAGLAGVQTGRQHRREDLRPFRDGVAGRLCRQPSHLGVDADRACTVREGSYRDDQDPGIQECFDGGPAVGDEPRISVPIGACGAVAVIATAARRPAWRVAVRKRSVHALRRHEETVQVH